MSMEELGMGRPAGIDHAAIRGWMLAYLATLTGRPSEELDAGEAMAVHDLDSVDAVEMALRFEQAFGVAIHPDSFLDRDASVESLAAALCGQLGVGRPHP